MTFKSHLRPVWHGAQERLCLHLNTSVHLNYRSQYSVLFPRNSLSCYKQGQQSAQAWVDAWLDWQGLTLTSEISKGIRDDLPVSDGKIFTDAP